MHFQGNSWIQKGHPQIFYGCYLTIIFFRIKRALSILFKKLGGGGGHMPPCSYAPEWTP